MEDLKLLSSADLFDLLMQQTNRHAHLGASGASPDQMTVSREILRTLQAEISLGKLREKNNHSYFPLQEQPSVSA